MAELYKVGEMKPVEVKPKNGTNFQLEELQELVEGFIELVTFEDGRLAVINEEGWIRELPSNLLATMVVFAESPDTLVSPGGIRGNMLVCQSSEAFAPYYALLQEPGDMSDEDYCSECGEELDLDGYDGLCSDCADAAEAEAEVEQEEE